MKISDIVTLAKAGYKPSDVLKLLEMVETSPDVKEVKAEISDKGDVEIKKGDDKPEGTEKKEEAPEDDDITKLVNLLKENS